MARLINGFIAAVIGIILRSMKHEQQLHRRCHHHIHFIFIVTFILSRAVVVKAIILLGAE